MRVSADRRQVHFQSPRSELILPLAQPGESWVFDTLNQIQAQVIGVEEQEVFDQIDSVKTIELSDGRIIQLSKSFGLLQYPFRIYQDDIEDYRDYPSYSLNLAGMRGRNVGKYLPNFKDFYDWKVGNTFVTKYVADHGLGRRPNIVTCYRVKVKHVEANTFRYALEGVKHDKSNINNQVGSIDKVEEFSEVITFIDSADHHLNRYNHEFRCKDGILPYYFRGASGIIYQGYTIDERAYRSRLNVSYRCYPYPDSAAYRIGCNGCGFLVTHPGALRSEAIFAPGRGRVLDSTFRMWSQVERLIAFQESGIHELCVMPEVEEDTLPPTGPGDVTQFNFFPNPASDVLNVEIPDVIERGTVILINTMGRIVKRIPFTEPRTQVSVEDVPAGCYYMQVYSMGRLRYKTILIIQR